MQPANLARPAPGLAPILAGFATVYLVWGSTFLAIRIAVETMPPWTMIGLRSIVAGAILYLLARRRGAPAPSRTGWRNGVVTGALLFVCGQGVLAWAEMRVPSGLAAVLVATMPLWVAPLGWLLGGEGKPSGRVLVGLALGFAGTLVLAAPDPSGETSLDPLGVVAILASSGAWALGMILSRRLPAAPSPMLASAMHLLGGGVLALLASFLLGEWSQFDASAVSVRSLLAVVYLVLFGSVVAFTAYTWLLSVCPPARVATYAYVNPIVALLLGWLLMNEPLGPRALLATAVILAGVAVVMLPARTQAPPRPVATKRAESYR